MSQIIFSKKDITSAASRIGKQLTEELKADKKLPVAVGIMKGSLNFMHDLIGYINHPMFTDYIQVSSYSGTKTTGKVILKRDLSIDVKDRTIILIEDVIDTGISMNYLLEFIKDRYHPKRIILVALFDKTYRRKVPVHIDYIGKTLSNDDFLLGYGLDYCEIGRNLPEVYGLNAEDIHKIDNLLRND